MGDFVRRTATADNGTDLEYYVYPEGRTEFERVMVYVHGLVSDINWFQVPEELPPDTGIVFMPRLPRIEVDRFETWTRNYELRLADFHRHHDTRSCHLVAQCFGVLASAHWSMTRPESFDTVTLVCPPMELRSDFSLRKKLSVLLGPRGGLQHCGLTPRSYGRSPAMMRFIEENPTTVWEFTNGLFLESNRIKRWIYKQLFAFPCVTHVIATKDDAVAELPRYRRIKDLPERTSVLPTDHFCELLPSRREFWRSVFEFQLEHEGRFELTGDVETVLVTGATGFLGSHIVRKLHADGKRVIVYARSVDKARKLFDDLGDALEVRAGTLEDLEALGTAMEGVDAVVHVAGFVSDWAPYEQFLEANVEGTKNVLLIAHEANVKQFVHISSLGVFGDTDQDNIDENNMYRWSSDHYSNSKILAEIVVRKYCTIHRIPYTVIRPGFIYGERDNNFLPTLIENVRAGKAKYIGSKQNILNTVYVGNIVELLSAAMGNPESFGETYNIADPQHTTVGRFMEDVANGMGLDPPTKIVPKPVALTAAAVFETIFRAASDAKAPPLTRKKVTFVARSRSVNASKAYALIGREPYSYEEGMKRTLASLTS